MSGFTTRGRKLLNVVEEWVKELTESVIGGSPVEVGQHYVHPEQGEIQIESGQYWGRHGISNFWTWTIVATGEARCGYAEKWPHVEKENGNA